MLTVYDGEVGYPISQDDYYIRELASGYDEVVFNVNIRDDVYQYIREEAVIRDRNKNNYLVKQIDAGEKTAKVVAQINLDDWKSAMFMQYTNNSATVEQTVTSVLPAGWSVIDQSLVTKRRTIPTSDTTGDYNVTALKVLEDCVSVYEVRFRFDTANKIVYIINPANYVSKGAFATRDLNLKKLNYKGKSDSFVTRLYAEGADGLTFADINDGKPYVENFNYANKIISYYWKDERYTDAESLLEDAQAKVDAMAIPSQSYDCDVLDLANTNPELYGFEDFSLFSIVTLVDDAKEVRTDYQVVEKWSYPYYPVNNKVMLSSSTPNIQSAIATVVNSITSNTSAFQQMLQSAIANATALITGNSGGYLVLKDTNGDGTPDELLIMDTPDIETATKVWRWNQAGLGYSSTGYNGQYEVGITMDGAIVADFITAGELNGDIIKAGTITTEAFTVESQQSLNVVHSYLPFDIFTNINRGVIEKGGGNPQVYFETITVDGESKTALVLDGTNLGNYNAWLSINTDFVGKPSFHYKYKMKLSADKTFTQRQNFLTIHYCPEGYSTYTMQAISWFPANSSVVADREYSVENNYQLSFSSDPYTLTPYWEFSFVDGEKIYLYDFEVYSTLSEYTKSSLSFTTDGLNSVVQQGAVISSINQSSEAVSIKADKINLTGALSLNGDFHCYNANDNTTYAFLDDGNLSFYNQGANIFTIASTPLLGSNAGIFFGDVEDPSSMADFTYITQEVVASPRFYAHVDDRYDTYLWPLVVEGSIKATEINVDLISVGGASNQYSTISGNVMFSDGTYGTGVYFYNTVYNSSGGQVFVSDKRKKKSIKDLVAEKARSFIMALRPREFKFIKKISRSGRKHHGFIAQELKEAMSEDWGVYIEDKEQDFIGLRYDEIIADMVAVIQDQQKRIEALERRVNDLTDNQS